MKDKIYETIIGKRKGYVVNVDYDRELHWNCPDSSFIILGKGKVNLKIVDDILKMESDNYLDEWDLLELNDTLDMYESVSATLDTAKVIVIKMDLMVEQVKLEGVIYVENIYTAEQLINHFCDRIDFNVELLVPLNNLRILNKMIKYYPEMIKFVKHVKINGQSSICIITEYNTEKAIRYDLNKDKGPVVARRECKLSRDYDTEEYDKKFNSFVKECNKLSTGKITNKDELLELMKMYSEYSVNPQDNVKKRNINDMENDEAYMNLYEQMKRNN